VISRYFLNDRGFYTGARDLFLQSALRGLEELASCIEGKDREGLRRLLHRLRSSAATVGAVRFARLCQLAEALDESSPLPTSWLQELAHSHHEFVEQSASGKDVGSTF
jgi:HPt (histidine-containing phosphotransfer) domain-containing protein